MTHRRGVVVVSALVALVFLAYLDITPANAAGREDLKQQYDPIVKTYSRRFNVPADLIHSIIKAESNYDSYAVSAKGAVGLMQLMPETAAQYGVRDLYDPDDNVMGGVKYLKDLCKLFNNNTAKVLAAYNAGQEALKKYKGIPPYPETIEYIRRVMASYANPFIKGGTPIRKFTTPDGKAVFTNDPYYQLNNRTDKQ
jgi:soluble lytic murein transglycosylase-like protein